MVYIISNFRIELIILEYIITMSNFSTTENSGPFSWNLESMHAQVERNEELSTAEFISLIDAATKLPDRCKANCLAYSELNRRNQSKQNRRMGMRIASLERKMATMMKTTNKLKAESIVQSSSLDLISELIGATYGPNPHVKM
jgi:hypothetical protein